MLDMWSKNCATVCHWSKRLINGVISMQPLEAISIFFLLSVRTQHDNNRGSTCQPDIAAITYWIPPWWHHDMKIPDALLALCMGNRFITLGFPALRTSNVERWCTPFCYPTDSWVASDLICHDGMWHHKCLKGLSYWTNFLCFFFINIGVQHYWISHSYLSGVAWWMWM